MSIVRQNLMSQRGYTPYCGNVLCATMPRTSFRNGQFQCSWCGWRSAFDQAFIDAYKAKWQKEPK